MRCKGRRHDQRFPGHTVRFRSRLLHRTRRHPTRIQTAAHAADVADERDLCDCRRRFHHGDRQRLSGACPHHGRGRPLRVDDEHRQRISDYGPHAEDVQDRSEGQRRGPSLTSVTQLAYIVATSLFIFALHWMNTPATARRGVYAGVAATTIAVVVPWFQPGIVHHFWIVVAILAGFAVGIPLSMVPLTAVPQRTALSHAFGGLAAGLVGVAEFYLWRMEGPEQLTAF